MSHYQQIEFCKLFKNEFFESKKISILELGSYDVNGSIRTIFDNTSKYIGLDLIKGPGVDIVYDGKDIPINQEFDLCISCECFEHNPNYFENFLKMIELAKKDGLVVFTCATIGRSEHGTTDSDLKSSPGSMEKWNYYKNLKKSHFTKRINLAKFFYKFLFFENYISKDLYFIGIKSKQYERNLLNFRNKILSKNTLVLDLNLTLRQIIIKKIKFLIDKILPSIIGDFLTRKIRIKLLKIYKYILAKTTKSENKVKTK
tara:strand:- start:144 stop:917 length:774 start_codon:yes stop_codon:yes gene_type:complete